VVHPSPPGEVRLIGGQWKRTRLKVPALSGLRPTPDRVRETLFNWLGQDLSGWSCVDVFAGTGALGLEAASRGACPVWLFEQHPSLVTQLQQLVQQLRAEYVEVVKGDGLQALRQLSPASLDAVFLDPPFDAPLFEPALRAAARVVADTGFVYLEAPLAWLDAKLKPLGLCGHRHLKAGAVHAHLLKPFRPGLVA
jgi:16S rRNA (guanine(966)-N(2))-methyltransferase RsmD